MSVRIAYCMPSSSSLWLFTCYEQWPVQGMEGLTTIYIHEEQMHGAIVAFTVAVITQLEIHFGLRPLHQFRTL